MLNVIIFGPPGAGKGTQSEHIVKKYGLLHTSTGDLLRAEIANKTKLGLEAKSFMDKGELVPDDVLIGMIQSRIANNPDVKGFLFDGFPRTVHQAEALDKLVQNQNKKINVMIALDVPKDILKERLLERGKTSGRADDQNEEKINKRLDEYHHKTKPVADYYSKQNTFEQVNGVGEIDTIFQNICQIIDKSI